MYHEYPNMNIYCNLHMLKYFALNFVIKFFCLKFYNFFFFLVCWYDLKRRCLKQLYRAGQRKKSSKKICFSQYGRNKRQTFGIVKYNHRKASRINSALLARAKRGSSITGQLDNSSIRLFCSLTLVSVTYRYVMQPILCNGYTFYSDIILRRYIKFKQIFLAKENNCYIVAKYFLLYLFSLEFRRRTFI